MIMCIPSSVLHEDAFPFQLHEQLSTTQILQNQVQLAARLECIDEVDNERMLFNKRQSSIRRDTDIPFFFK